MKIHNWTRESSRRSCCQRCGLIAKTKNSFGGQAPYTEWSWQGNRWDSRSSPTPTCPPRHA